MNSGILSTSTVPGDAVGSVIQLTQTDISVTLNSVELDATSVFQVSGGNPRILFSGVNTISTSIHCNGDAVIEFSGVEDDSELHINVENTFGIGTCGSCDSLIFNRGRYFVNVTTIAGQEDIQPHGAGIGTCGKTSSTSGDARIKTLSFVSGEFTIWNTGGGAAIGSGSLYNSEIQRVSVDEIIIDGGIFNLDVLSAFGESTALGAGIGTGQVHGGSGDHAVAEVGEITVRGGTFAIRTEKGAGIGSGFANFTGADWYEASNGVSSITITGGEFDISTVYAAGIGSGAAEGADVGGPLFGKNWAGDITISDGDFHIVARGGAGIGSGPAYAAENRVGDITITGGEFTIEAKETEPSAQVPDWSGGGAGIGTGSVHASGKQVARSISISDASLTATWVYGAGVGAGAGQGGLAQIGTITFRDGLFNGAGKPLGGNAGTLLTYGCGIGLGNVGDVDLPVETTIGLITVSGSEINVTGDCAAIGCGAVQESPVTMEGILVDDCILNFDTWSGVGVLSLSGTGDALILTDSITVSDVTCNITARFCGIGSGMIAGGQGSIDIPTVSVRDASGRIDVESGTCIGSGGVEGNGGTQSITLIEVVDSPFLELTIGSGTGIGMGSAQLTGTLVWGRLDCQKLSVRDSNIQITADGSSAGIGLGQLVLAIGEIATIEVISWAPRDVLIINAYEGAGIGTGAVHVRHGGIQEGARIGRIEVMCPIVRISTTAGACIGSGLTLSGGLVEIGDILVTACDLTLRSMSGACIGLGEVRPGVENAEIQSLVVSHCQLRATSGAGAIIGTGTVGSTATIGLIEVVEVNAVSLSCESGAVVGSGSTRATGVVSLPLISVEGGGFPDISVGTGAAFGTGEAAGKVTIGILHIDRTTLGGSGRSPVVGTGHVSEYGAIAEIGSIVMDGVSTWYSCGLSAGIGTGLTESGTSLIGAIEFKDQLGSSSLRFQIAGGVAIGLGRVANLGSSTIGSITAHGVDYSSGVTVTGYGTGLGIVKDGWGYATISSVVFDDFDLAFWLDEGTCIGVASENSVIGDITISAHMLGALVVLSNGDGVGLGVQQGGRIDNVLIDGISVFGMAVQVLTGVGFGVLDDGAVGSIVFNNVTGYVTGDDRAFSGASFTEFRGANLQILGDVAFGPRVGAPRDSEFYRFTSPVSISCESANVSLPCMRTVTAPVFVGDNLTFFVTGRRFAGEVPGEALIDVSLLGTANVSAKIFYTAPTIPDQLGNSSVSLRRVTMDNARPVGLQFGSLEPFTYDPSVYVGLSVFLPPSCYRVTYADADIDGVLVGDDGYSLELCSDGSKVNALEGRLLDIREADGSGAPWRWAFVALGGVVFIFLVIGIVRFCVLHREKAALGGDPAGNDDIDLDKVPEEEEVGGEETGVKAILAGLVAAVKAETFGGKVKGVLWFLLILLLSLLSFLTSYVGFALFFFVSLFLVASLIVAIFSNALVGGGRQLDFAVQLLLWVYIMPVIELLVFLVIRITIGFFMGDAFPLDLTKVTKSFRLQLKADRCGTIFRISWMVLYFGVMLALFIICLGWGGTDVAAACGTLFAVVCVVLPLVAVIRPLLQAWRVLFFDRRRVDELPERKTGAEKESRMSASHSSTSLSTPETETVPKGERSPSVDPATPKDPAVREEELPPSTIDSLLESDGIKLYDPLGMLARDDWSSYLPSRLTGTLRPQFCKPLTFIPLIIFAGLAAVLIFLDNRRTTAVYNLRQDEWKELFAAGQASADEWSVAWPSTDSLAARDVLGVVIRAVAIVLVLPFVVLANVGQLFRGFTKMKNSYSAIFVAKVIGFVLLIAGVIAAIVGVSVRHRVEFYDGSTLYVDPNAVDQRSVTAAPELAFCRAFESDWSLQQLAAVPALAMMKWNGNLDGVHNLSLVLELAAPSWMESVDSSWIDTIDSAALFIFGPAEQGLLVGLEPMSPQENFGCYVEHSLPMVFEEVVLGVIPFYSIARSVFLDSITTDVTDALMGVVLGPNRLSVQSAIRADATAGLGLRLVYQVMETKRMAAAPPVVVGHSGSGLLAKAVDFEFDPWRVAFEAFRFDQSPLLGAGYVAHAVKARTANFFTETTLLDQDTAAAWNVRFPPYGKTIPVPVSPFETLCVVQAGCGQDARLDQLCTEVMGDEYLQLWDTFERPRQVIDPLGPNGGDGGTGGGAGGGGAGG